MVDRISKEHRSWNMSRIKGRDTKPEIKVRCFLHHAGLRFRLHRKDLPGQPDIVLPKYRTCIFVHGCFWHRHPECKYAYEPKSRVEFWQKKFRDNVERDSRNREDLKNSGWNVVVLWECQIADEKSLSNHMRDIFKMIEYPERSEKRDHGSLNEKKQ